MLINNAAGVTDSKNDGEDMRDGQGEEKVMEMLSHIKISGRSQAPGLLYMLPFIGSITSL